MEVDLFSQVSCDKEDTLGDEGGREYRVQEVTDLVEDSETPRLYTLAGRTHFYYYYKC